jgi:hypothetical protein
MWLDQGADEVKEQIAGHEYDGDIRVTKTGKTCQEPCWVNMDNGYLYCETAAGIFEECSIKCKFQIIMYFFSRVNWGL